jgi:hypothetical protein
MPVKINMGPFITILATCIEVADEESKTFMAAQGYFDASRGCLYFAVCFAFVQPPYEVIFRYLVIAPMNLSNSRQGFRQACTEQEGPIGMRDFQIQCKKGQNCTRLSRKAGSGTHGVSGWQLSRSGVLEYIRHSRAIETEGSCGSLMVRSNPTLHPLCSISLGFIFSSPSMHFCKAKLPRSSQKRWNGHTGVDDGKYKRGHLESIYKLLFRYLTKESGVYAPKQSRKDRVGYTGCNQKNP